MDPTKKDQLSTRIGADRRNKLLKLLRLILFSFAIYATVWYFFSFVSLAIGLSYFLFNRDPNWKRHGLVLAWITAISSFILILIAFSNANGAPSISTTYLSMAIGPGSLIFYGVFYIIHDFRQRKNPISSRGESKFVLIIKQIQKSKKIATIIACLVPIGLWGSLNLDFGVMFDNSPILLWLHGPTTVNIDAEFDFTVEAWDSYERLSALYTGTVEFDIQSYNLTTLVSIPSPVAELPSSYTFTGQFFPSDMAYQIRDGKDNGLHVFSISISTPGIHYILVEDSITEMIYWSNPIIVDNFGISDEKIYWGDIHTHSMLSDGSGTPEHHYYYARHIAELDYCALSDHGETMQFSPGALDTLEFSSNNAYDPDHFVAFQAVEWTQAKAGHYTCVFSGDKITKNPPISFFALPTAPDLWNVLDDFTESTNCRALAIPHHTTKQEYPQDWTYVNYKYVKFAEVTSTHGECLFEQRDPLNYRGCGDPPAEYTPGTAVMDAFKMNYRLTCMGGSDEHDGHPGHSLGHTNAYIGHQRPMTTWINRIDIPYPGGITAVRALNLTREGIFNGLERSRVYGSSDHGRPYLDISINGTKIEFNSTLKVSNVNAIRNISIFLAQDGSPAANKRPYAARMPSSGVPDWAASIEILKNGALLTQISVNSPVVYEEYLDSTPITGVSYGIENCYLKDGKYYINEFSDNEINPADLTTGGVDFYVFRVVGDNGRTIYAGPIWVEFE